MLTSLLMVVASVDSLLMLVAFVDSLLMVVACVESFLLSHNHMEKIESSTLGKIPTILDIDFSYNRYSIH